MSILYKFPKLYNKLVEDIKSIPQMKELTGKFKNSMEIDQLKPGSLVLDLACGTGEWAFTIAEKRPDVRVVGLDYSQSMIDFAIEETQRKGLKNISFVRKSATELSLQDLLVEENGHQQAPLDMIVSCMGYSAIKEQEEAFQHTASFLAPGGRYVIMDSHQPNRNFITLFMKHTFEKWLVGANQYTKPWLYLEQNFTNFSKDEVIIKDFGFLPVTYYVAQGMKPV